MNVLPLYVAKEVSPLRVESLEPNPKCERCQLSKHSKSPCLRPQVSRPEPGGVLLVGERPSIGDDTSARIFSSDLGVRLRGWVTALEFPGPVYFDNAVKCGCGTDDAAVRACAPYLARTIEDTQPSRIATFGPLAARAVLGRSPPPLTRRAYAALLDGPPGWKRDGPVPVYMMAPLTRPASNRFHERDFREDLRWAFMGPIPELHLPNAITRQVMTEEDALIFEADMRAHGEFAFDVETFGKQHDVDFCLLSASFCARGEQDGWVVHADELAKPEVGRAFDRLMADRSIRKTGQNTKYDAVSWQVARGVPVEGIAGDTRLMRKLLEPEAEGNLADMAYVVGMGGHKEEAEDAKEKARAEIAQGRRNAKKYAGQMALISADSAVSDSIARLRGKPADDSRIFAFIPRDVLLRYNTRDSITTMRLSEQLERQLAGEPELEAIWQSIVRPAVRAVSWMEFWGIQVSRESVGNFQSYLDTSSQPVFDRLVAASENAGFNPASVPQVRALLYDKLRLPVSYYTDSGEPSTDEEALEHLKLLSPVASDMLLHRKLEKLKDYALGKDGKSGLMQHLRDDGRIHGSINLDGARTGRLSMSDPNLQNIPSEKRDKINGKMARDCFVAAPGCVLLSFDYSQAELRALAMLSGDEEMKKIFREGVDYHLRTAQLISFVWGKRPEEVGSPERQAAKTVNFGLVYGQGDKALASSIGCDEDQAATIRAAILGHFKGLDRWISQRIAETTVTGYAWTWWNGQRARRRPLYAIANRGDRRNEALAAAASKARNGSFNTPAQGTANEFCLASAVACVERIVDEGMPAKLLFPIHDALLFEVPEKRVGEVVAEVVPVMEGWPSLGVPMKVDVDVGYAWGSLERFLGI